MLAQRFGLDPDVTASAIEQLSGGESGLSTAAKYFRDDTVGMLAHAPASTIEKDMDLAEAMAAAAGVRCRTLDVTADFFTAVGTTPFRELRYRAVARSSPTCASHGGTSARTRRRTRRRRRGR